MFFKTGGVVFYFCTNTRATRGKTNSLRTNQSVWTEKLKPASFYLSNSPIVVLMNTCCPFSLVCGFIVVISQIKCGNMCSSITLHILCAVLKSSLCRRHWILFFLFFALFFSKLASFTQMKEAFVRTCSAFEFSKRKVKWLIELTMVNDTLFQCRSYLDDVVCTLSCGCWCVCLKFPVSDASGCLSPAISCSISLLRFSLNFCN